MKCRAPGIHLNFKMSNMTKQQQENNEIVENKAQCFRRKRAEGRWEESGREIPAAPRESR